MKTIPWKSYARAEVNRAALTETVLLAGLAMLILLDTVRGTLFYYIHPRSTPLVIVSAIVLLLFALERSRGLYAPPQEVGPERTALYLLLCLPLVFGVLVPPQALGAEAGSGRGLVNAGLLNGIPPNGDTRTWTLLDWAAALNAEGARLAHAPVQVTGFVYHEASDSSAPFDVARTVITCCVADSRCVGLPVVWQGAAMPPANGWVKVSGEIGQIDSSGSKEFVILAQHVEPTTPPDNPYLYP